MNPKRSNNQPLDTKTDGRFEQLVEFQFREPFESSFQGLVDWLVVPVEDLLIIIISFDNKIRLEDVVFDVKLRPKQHLLH